MYQHNYADSEVCYNCMDDTDSFGCHEDFLGIGKRDKQKKAEKKIAKAEKQLAKGHVKAAERKLKKGTAILNKIQSGQQAISDAQKQIGNINATNAVLSGTNTMQTESQSTAPGQIGTEAGSTTMPASAAALQSMGGGGGDTGGDSMPDVESTSLQTAQETPTDVKDLPGVTVKNKNWTMILIIIVVISIVAFFVLPKLLKKK